MEFNNQYLNYDEYKQLGGTLEEMLFNILEYKARKIVDKYTFGRLINLNTQIQEVKMCVYDLINLLNKNNNIKNSANSNSNIASENIDGYSVSYVNNNTEESEKQNKSIVIDYLSECKLDDGTPYCYCGVDYDSK